MGRTGGRSGSRPGGRAVVRTSGRADARADRRSAGRLVGVLVERTGEWAARRSGGRPVGGSAGRTDGRPDARLAGGGGSGGRAVGGGSAQDLLFWRTGAKAFMLAVTARRLQREPPRRAMPIGPMFVKRRPVSQNVRLGRPFRGTFGERIHVVPRLRAQCVDQICAGFEQFWGALVVSTKSKAGSPSLPAAAGAALLAGSESWFRSSGRRLLKCSPALPGPICAPKPAGGFGPMLPRLGSDEGVHSCSDHAVDAPPVDAVLGASAPFCSVVHSSVFSCAWRRLCLSGGGSDEMARERCFRRSHWG